MLTLLPLKSRRVSCNAPLAHIPGDRVGGEWRWVHARPSDPERARALARITAPLAGLPMVEVLDSPPSWAPAPALGVRRKARPTRRADSATTRAGPASSSSSPLWSSASQGYRSASSEDNVRLAMEALILSERRDGERRVRFEETGSEDRLRGTMEVGQSACGQAMVEARERVRARQAEAEAEKVEEWEVVEQEEEEEEEESIDEESIVAESTDEESSDDEEWVLQSDGIVVAEVVEFV
ncbi:hypothetical protein LTR35_000616 [Friedmanniomyces endolithicus]|uniref:Uncharacterized protein n=1 Tax=Friedmanniomyces endolithicus TaxID=329885 RepID=A0AAN6J2F6_9PEZI|nr:hypothetical protein LTS00_013946 [Friedmanniomyces endolithicus]KAK0292586.1 hypothetical protein LTR35_000616 [Friedmanniomyces endolithicus]KAK0309661.1 hypothetical protein LTR82_015013 [Friedmanniomyces endolithicus]KAK1007675.1 hypothetical protein LTR54_006402 [Friedmanniomyces endolithicus]